MDKGTVACLTRARELLRVGWCQGVNSCSAEAVHEGRVLGVATPETRSCYCAVQAMFTGSSPRDFNKAWSLLGSVIGRFRSIPVWNDSPTRTHAEVLAAFDRAIELASKLASKE